MRMTNAARPFFLSFAMTATHTPWLPPKAREYGDFVAMVNDTVGQVLNALEQRGLVENTLVIVTSDNGAHWLPDEVERWHHRVEAYLRGRKADIWDGGHRIPFPARWPGRIQPGTQSNQAICLTDLMGTTAALMHYPLPRNAGEESYCVLPALLNSELTKPIREATVHHSAHGHFSIRQGDWKLNREDPAEATNLYLKLPDKVAQLSVLSRPMRNLQ